MVLIKEKKGEDRLLPGGQAATKHLYRPYRRQAQKAPDRRSPPSSLTSRVTKAPTKEQLELTLKTITGPGETAQWFRALTALSEGPEFESQHHMAADYPRCADVHAHKSTHIHKIHK